MSKPDVQAIRAQLQRILASSGFVHAERMRRFLQLAVTEALEGRAGQLKEYTIGVSVFDRPPAFDPAVDPLVRVEARRLRAKLEKYYEGEGRGDRIVIELPKGGYAACFRFRETDAPTPAQAPNSIAVLPFQNVGVAPDGQYFSDGLTWELIHQLTRVEGISVVAWNSAAQVRESSDVLSAGARLKAATVLTGSVRQARDRLRIIAQLIDVHSGVYLWSETYDRKLEDIFAIEDDIARSIVSRLQTRLAVAGDVVKPASSYNLEAYQLYLKGRALWNQRTSDGLNGSLHYFEKATEVDGMFALGYAGIADAYALLADYGHAFPAELVPVAKRAALRALEIDPSLGEAHCSLAFLTANYEWKWREGEVHFRRALALNPGYATAHHWLGTDVLALVGRFDEALRENELAQRLDPLSPIIGESPGYMLLLTRRYQEAEQYYRDLAATFPSFYKAHTALGRTLLQMGRFDEAILELERGRRLGGGDFSSILGAMGQAHALNGNRDEAVRLLGTLEEISRARFVPATCFALIHLGLGDKKRALERLRRGVDQHELSVCALAVHPAYDSLRDEPEFRVLLERMGLPTSVTF